MVTHHLRVGDCGPWEPLRELRKRLVAAQNHPHYTARGNEQPLLQDLIAGNPPAGGMAAYIADLDGDDSDCSSSPKEGNL